MLRRLAIVFLFAAGATASFPPGSFAQTCAANVPHVTGTWVTLPYLMPINPISVTLLRTGQVLIVAGSENDAHNDSEGAESYRAAVWDPTGATESSIAVQNLTYDVFCSGTAALPDGRPLVVGGTSDYTFKGENRASFFDPATGAFVQSQNMAVGRWYATATALGDGRIMAFSGLDLAGGTTRKVEIYDLNNAGAGWSTTTDFPLAPPLYPRVALLPSGNVFYTGHGSSAASNPTGYIFNPANGTWTPSAPTTRNRVYGSAVILPLLPPSYTPRVMALGGGNPASATTEIIDLSAPSPSWTAGPNMSSGRIQMNAVILPNGKVLAEGGSLNNEAPSLAGKTADLYDPVANTMSPAGAAAYSRLYHSVALLLPDATVASLGSNPGARGSYLAAIEIYTPPYLYDANDQLITTGRPSITGTSPASGVIGYGEPFSADYTSSSPIASAVLVRPGSPTHAEDMEQRLIGLCGASPQPACSDVGTGRLGLMSPPNGNIAPPGYYMLFLLDSAGVPSKAQFIQLSLHTGQPPSGTIASPATDLTIPTGGSVNFNTSDSAAKYSWVFPGGSPWTSVAQAPGIVTFSTPGTYTTSLTEIDAEGNSDPSPPTRTITVLPAAADFHIAVSPPAQEVNPGESTTFTVTVSPLSGFAGSVSLSVDSESGFQTGISSGGFSPASISGSGTSMLTMNTTSGTKPWALSLTITGTSGTLTHTASTTLLVNLAPPSGLGATPGSGQVSLSWAASVGANSYHVKRATESGGPYVTVGCPTATSYVDTGLSNGTTYYYVVSGAFSGSPNSGGESADSSEASATPLGSQPAAPTGLTATPGNAQVALTWTASAGATSYRVKRATLSSGPYTVVASPVSNSYTNTGLTNGTTYYYVVSAVSGGGESPNSAQVSATPQGPPVIPTGVTAIPGNAQVALNWAGSAGATSYNVKRATVSGGPYAVVASPVSTSYTNTGLTNGTTYYYVVSAVSGGGESANSAQVSATPQPPPAAPTGLTATPGNAQVALTWTASAGATGYKVKRATVSGGPYALVASPASTSYTNTGLTNGTTYYYVVSAVTGSAESPNSAQVSATPLGSQPAAPTGLTATPGNAQVALTWTASAGATSYNVKRATVSGGPYAVVASPVSTSYTNTGLTNGTTYYYVVSAVNGGGESPNSAQVSATPQAAPPAAPTGLTATPGNAQVALTWTASAGATSYNVKRATVSGGPYAVVASPVSTSYTNTGLTNGTTYYYVVSAVNGGGESPNSAQVSATPQAPPAAPTGVTATPGNAQVALTWTASAGATSYNVKRATVSGGPYAVVASPVSTSYTNTGLTNGTTYYYVVSAVNGGGESPNSAQVSATPQAPPAAPTGVTATPGNAQVALTWTASAGATSYNVKRATVSGGPYAVVASPVSTSYTNTGLTNGTTYYYVVSAVNGGGESPNSAQVSATPQAAPPAAPTGLTATPGNAQVALTWTASAGATSYNVKRATVSGGPYAVVASPVSTSYTNTGLTNGTTYYYVVSAVNGGGESPNSAQVSATPQAAPPAAPTGVTATPGNAQVALTWTASAGATSYNVKRATVSGGPYAVVASPVSTSYTNTGLTNGTTYYYVVSAVNGGGESPNSAQVSATPQAPPAAPTGVTATPGNAQVALTWTASAGATSYNVKRATVSGGPYAVVASPVSTSYTNTGLTNGTTYYYVVSAVNGGGESPNSAQVSATPQAPPAAPTGVTATPGNAQVALTWTASAGATSYNVKRATVSGGPYAVVASPVSTSYTNTGLTNGTTYYYVVSAVNGGGESPNSAQVSATPQPPPPAAPTGLTATPGNAQVALTWTASAGATSYNVKRATVSGGPYAVVASPVSNSYTNTGLTNGTTYYYVVSAVNGGGESPNSAQVSATPQAAPPAAPTGLTATPGNAQVALTWTGSAGATSYNVKRATVSGGPYAVVASPVSTSYTNTGLTNGTTYYYVVSAVNGGGESPNSAQVSATPQAAPPAAPTGLTATPGNAQVALTWTASAGATSYNVKRATVSGGPYAVVASPVSTSYTNTGLTNGTTYYYVVSAVNGGGESPNSAQVSAKPQAPPPAPPTALTATPRRHSVTLRWTQSTTPGVTANNVYRRTGTGTYPATPTATFSATTSYVDSGLSNHTTYCYVVTASSGVGQSVPSNETCTTTR